MTYYNNAISTKRELLVRILKLKNENSLLENIDRIPLEMRPRTNSPIRCCVHKDRAVIKYKIMALLGFNIADEQDELTPLKEYAQRSLAGQERSGNFLTVVDEACSSCVQVNYTVTNLCQGCEARSCKVNCPKDAIAVLNGKAIIDNQKCINCGLCQKACPFHAIAYLSVPCEQSCPVDAIKKNKNGVEEINFDKCIHCGKCMTACPFGAINEKSEVLNIFKTIKEKKVKVVAIVAPAVLGQFKTSSTNILSAIKKIGFYKVIEVAEGAELTAKNEAEELIEHLNQGAPFMTTSCCPAYVELTDKHLTPIKPFVSHTPTPMAYTAKMAKEENPDCKVVFIGPCLAKRKEGFTNQHVDHVMTSEELGAFLTALNIDVDQANGTEITQGISAHARGFALSGGVTNAVKSYLDKGYDLQNQLIDGLTKKSIRLLKSYPTKNPPFNFIEVMACEGGCISGPVNLVTTSAGSIAMKKAIQEVEFEPCVE